MVAHRRTVVGKHLVIVWFQAPIESVGGAGSFVNVGRGDDRIDETSDATEIAVARYVALEIVEADEHAPAADLDGMPAGLGIDAERQAASAKLVFEMFTNVHTRGISRGMRSIRSMF